jgi:hypothetical protein
MVCGSKERNEKLHEQTKSASKETLKVVVVGSAICSRSCACIMAAGGKD